MKKYFIIFIIINLLVPNFGFAKNLTITTDNVKQDYQTEIQHEETGKKIIVFLFIAILFSWLAAYLGRTKSWWAGGIIGFGLGAFIWWISKIWFFMPLFLISGLIYDSFVSRHYKEYRSCKKGKFWCSIKKSLK